MKLFKFCYKRLNNKYSRERQKKLFQLVYKYNIILFYAVCKIKSFDTTEHANIFPHYDKKEYKFEEFKY